MGYFPSQRWNFLFFSQKRVRFPKGKKVKTGDAFVDIAKAEENPSDLTDPRFAAKERAKRRNQMTADLFSEENRGVGNDISAAEVTYEVRFSFKRVSILVLSCLCQAVKYVHFNFFFVLITFCSFNLSPFLSYHFLSPIDRRMRTLMMMEFKWNPSI